MMNEIIRWFRRLHHRLRSMIPPGSAQDAEQDLSKKAFLETTIFANLTTHILIPNPIVSLTLLDQLQWVPLLAVLHPHPTRFLVQKQREEQKT